MGVTLKINGHSRELEPVHTASVETLMDHLAATPKRGVAVAVNDTVVPRSHWSHHPLRDGDRVEIIQATQGG